MDASKYLGEQVYIKVVDNSIVGFGHVNVDDFHVYNTVSDITNRATVIRSTVSSSISRQTRNG